MDAVYELLQHKSVRDLTIEEVARRAGVGKPTIYRWWPSKAALVMDMFEERVVPQYGVPRDDATAEPTGFDTRKRKAAKLILAAPEPSTPRCPDEDC